MRVIAGTAKGCNLKTIDSLDTRPTTDRVKEALFNILNFKIYNSQVLDLFAGSGALGIEALSRGARSAVFIEQSKKAASVIKQNLEHTKLISLSDIKICDVLSYLKKSSQKFDLIFMDPPYHSDLIPEAIKKIDEFELLKGDGIIIAECDKTETTPGTISSFHMYDQRKYGRVIINLFKKDD